MPPKVPNTIAVDISNKKDLKKVGGAMSKRLPINLKMEDGSVIKGFYTENTYTNYLERYKAVFDDAIKQIREKGANSPKLERSIKFLLDLKENVDPNSFFIGLFTSARNNSLEKIQNNNTLADSNNFTRAALESMHARNPKFGGEKYMDEGLFDNNEVLCDVMKDVIDIGYSLGAGLGTAFEEAKMQKGKVTINKRNNALYEVSEKIGEPELICKSVNMITTKDGVKSNGTFMLNAKGTDFRNLKPVVVKNQIIPLSFSKEAYRDISKLQVIDYLTGNIDRHVGNMFYNIEFQKGNRMINLPPKMVVKGIQGIDNDLSFGAISGDSRVNHMSSLSEIRVIDRKQAAGILDMKPEDLEKIMRNAGLGRTEVEAGLSRLNKLQTAIKKNKIKQIEGDDWGKIKVSDLAKTNGMTRNIWGKLSTVNEEYMDQTKGSISLTDFQNNQNEQPDTELNEIKNESEKLLYESQLDNLLKLKEDFDKTNPEKASPDFKEMYDGLKDLIDTIKTRAIDKEPSQIDINVITEMYAEQERLSAKYIKKKPKNPVTDNGKERLHLAKNMLQQIQTGRNMVMEESVASFNRRMTTESNKLFEKYQPLIDIDKELRAQGENIAPEVLADKVKAINEMAELDKFKDDKTFDEIASGLEGSILNKLGKEKSMELLGTDELKKCDAIAQKGKKQVKKEVDKELSHEAQKTQEEQKKEDTQVSQEVQNSMGSIGF